MEPSSSKERALIFSTTTTFPTFYTFIPASIRRHFPSLYRSLHVIFGSDGRLEWLVGKNNSDNSNGTGDSDMRRSISASYGQMESHSTGNDAVSIAGTVRQRPVMPDDMNDSAGNKRRDPQRSLLNVVDESSSSDGESQKRPESATPENAIAKYEAETGLKWNRIGPGKFFFFFFENVSP